MAKKANRDAAARAEARRRARLMAQGRVLDEEADTAEANSAGRGPTPGFLQRIFPPAASLPGKPDPLAGFSYSGRWGTLVSSLWLIPRNPFAGIGMGIVWGAAWIATYMYGKALPGTIASFISFGSLVAAGWIGWQRPWLYGLVAAFLGYLVFLPYFVAVVAPTAISAGSTPGAVAEFLGVNGMMQLAIGTVAGFYGGYLRRRMSDPTLRRTAPPARRANGRR
jgi:hypothetical protein